MRFTFWGTRGSIAVPGQDTLRFGGNTTCLQVTPSSGLPVIVDAGTGIRSLGLELCQSNTEGEVLLLITHLHWDHILGFLFFDPVYHPGWKVRVSGWPKALTGLKSIFNSRHADGNFPVDWDDLPGLVEVADELKPPSFSVDGMAVRTAPLNHPQGGVAFRFEENGKAFVFATDNELMGPGSASMDDFVKFVSGAQVLVHDAQYLPEEMPSRYGYGHSDYLQAVELARKAGVERLILTHHDPTRSDDQVDDILAKARESVGPDLEVDAASEGLTVVL
jgi:phosphoribosyl 1,2-cyclic phosphodiesterase